MFDAPYEKIYKRINEVVSVEGIEANGTIVARCPLCAQSNAMRVHDKGRYCRCANCDFVDDLVGLLAAATQRSVEQAAVQMELEGEQLHRYIANRQKYDVLESTLAVGQRRVLSGEWNVIYELLATNGIYIQPGYSLEALSEHTGVLHANDLTGSGLTNYEEFDALARWSRRSPFLVIPLYETPLRPCGVMAIKRNGQVKIARFGLIARYRPKLCMTQLRQVKPSDPACIVIPDPYLAWQLTMKISTFSRPIAPIVGVWSGDLSIRKLNSISSKSLYFWGQDVLTNYRWCSIHQGSRVVTTPWLGEFDTSDSPTLLREAIDTATDRFSAAAAFIGSRPKDDGKAFVRELDALPHELNSIMSAAPIFIADHVRSVIYGDQAEEIVEYNGKTISPTDGGWYAGPDLVSEAIIELDSIFTTGSHPVVSGVIRYQGNRYDFRDKLSAVRRGANWLENFLVSEGADIPKIAKKWRTHLYDIAMEFHRPSTSKKGREYGWNEGYTKLALANFDVTGSNINPLTELNPDIAESSAGMEVPPNLGSMMVNKYPDIMKSRDFWYLFIFIAAKLLQEPLGHSIPSLAVSRSASADQWITYLQSALKLRRDTTANPQSVVAHETTSILPIVVLPVSPPSLNTWLHLPVHNAIFREDYDLLHILNYHGWLVRDFREPPPDGVEQVFQQVFWYVSWAIKHMPQLQQDATEKGPFWVIGESIKRFVKIDTVILHSVQDATHQLYRDHGYGSMRRDEGSRLLMLLRGLEDNGMLEVEHDENGRYVIVYWHEVVQQLERFKFKHMTYKLAKRNLANYLFQSSSPDNELHISNTDWVLHGTVLDR